MRKVHDVQNVTWRRWKHKMIRTKKHGGYLNRFCFHKYLCCNTWGEKIWFPPDSETTGFSVFFLKPGPFPIACSWNSRYLFELIYISSDFDHGDVIKATASYRYVGGFQKVAFFNKKSTSTMVKWHFQGPCFFWFPAVAKIWLKF